jgi:hypothetical protein
MRRSFSPVAGALAAVLVLVACGDDGGGADGSGANTTIGATSAAGTSSPSSGPPAGSLPDPCGLLGDDVVRDVLGEIPAARETSSPAGAPEFAGCTWGSVSAAAGVLAVSVSKPSGPAKIDDLAVRARTARHAGVAAVPGTRGATLYETALLPAGGGAGHSVLFRKGGVTVVVAMTRGGADKTQAVARVIAERVG